MLFLELDRPFQSPWEASGGEVPTIQWEPVRREVVLGEGLDGTRCTLLEATQLGTTFVGRWLLLGGHFNRQADAAFDSAVIRLTELEKWTGVSPLAATFGGPLPIPTSVLAQKDPGTPFTIEVAYRERSLVEVQIPTRECQIEIISRADMSSGYQLISIANAAYIGLRPSSAQTLTWYINMFADCTRLFSFLAGRPLYRRQTLLHPQNVSVRSDLPARIEFYDGQKVGTEEEERAKAAPLPLALVRQRAQEVFQNWFRASDEAGPIFQFMIETLPPNDSEVVTVALKLTQALEVFVRRSIAQTYVTEDEYDRRYYKAMFEALPGSHACRFEGSSSQLSKARERIFPEKQDRAIN